MGHFLEYVPGDSFLHKMNPVAKLACAFLLCVAYMVDSTFSPFLYYNF